jgi:hypothetical protein
MKGYLLGAALLAACAWGYLQTKKLSGSGIEAFYQTDAETTGHHYTDASCALLADDFRGSSSGVINGMAVPQRTIGKSEFCDNMKKFSDTLENFEKRSGRSAEPSYSTDLTDTTYAADHRSATVHVAYQYRLLGGRLMNVHGTRVDTLVKRDGKVLLLATEDHTNGTIGPQ